MSQNGSPTQARSPNEDGEEQQSIDAVVTPDTIRVTANVPTPTVEVTHTSASAQGTAMPRAKAHATVTSSTGEQQEVDAVLSRPTAAEYNDEYVIRVTGGPGEWLEAAVTKEAGEVILHTIRKTGADSYWATADVVGEIAEALFRDIEGL